MSSDVTSEKGLLYGQSSLETSHYFDHIEVSCARIPLISSLQSRVHLKLQHIILIILKSAVQEFHWYLHHHQEFTWNFNTLLWSHWSQLCKYSIDIFITIKSSLETSTHYFDHIEVSCARIPLISSLPLRVPLKLQHIILITLKSAVQEFHWYLHHHQEFTWNFNTLFWSHWSQLCKNSINIFITIIPLLKQQQQHGCWPVSITWINGNEKCNHVIEPWEIYCLLKNISSKWILIIGGKDIENFNNGWGNDFLTNGT